MPYTIDNAPERIKSLPKHVKEIWIAAYNSAFEQDEGDEEKCNAVAWAAVKEKYEKNEKGEWVMKKSEHSELIPVFRTGTHTDSNGNTKTWTEEDLDAIVSKYNPAEHEAPVVIGHPKDNAPAWGWIEALERKGSVLYAKLKDLIPNFVEMLKQGLFKKRSISLYPDMTLRHIGFLGAMPPAVKGLPDVAFNNEQIAINYELEDLKIKDDEQRTSFIERIAQKVKDILNKENSLPSTHEGINNFLNKEGDMEKIQELEAKLKEREKEIADFSEKDKAKDAEIAKLKKELADEKAKNQRTEFAAFCDSDEMKEKITPAMKSAILDFMEIFSGVETYEFVEVDDKGTEKKVKKAPVKAFKDFLKTLPKSVDFSEVATKKKAGDKGGTAVERLTAEINEKMKANKDLTYNMAFTEVQKENPELAAEYAAEIRE